MHDAVQVRRAQTDLAEQMLDAADNGFAGIIGGGEQLAGVDEIAPGIMQHEIGEGTADIDTETRARAVHRGWSGF